MSALYAQMIENVAYDVLTVDKALETFEEDMKGTVGDGNVKVIE